MPCAPKRNSSRSPRLLCASRTSTTCRSRRRRRTTMLTDVTSTPLLPAEGQGVRAVSLGGLSTMQRATGVTHDRILILDFGSQVTQLIARRLRETHVYCEIHPYDVSDDFVRECAPKGVILSGSHASVTEDASARAPQAVFELGVPVLGICYGMQTMAA